MGLRHTAPQLAGETALFGPQDRENRAEDGVHEPHRDQLQSRDTDLTAGLHHLSPVGHTTDT